MAGFAISPLHERNEYRRIRLVNYISLISAASDIVFITFYSLIGFQELRVPIFILILAFPVFFIPILLNRYKYFLAAKLLIVSFNTLLTTLIAIFFFGPDPGIHVFLLIFGFIPLFVWSYKQWFYIVVFFTLKPRIICYH
jgi:predicted neutral ceramidase superfamily lipid hydrolase